ncbi:SLC13 family permease [Haloarchaeobius litoreus]|uniref:SLC13 family permease n=1 Tax=Haloarchaeobius litoreus TaxID=755306 RepID=A0ABD6DL37_9EURY|nr:SLC13 family permease [Haloarchaeobius litoreus]
MAVPEPTTAMLVVFAITAVALLSFVAEVVSPDVTALSVLVSLVVLEPWTTVGPATAISGFASAATVTIMAMYMLSEGVQRTGAVQWLGAVLARVTDGNERRVLAATVGTTGPLAGIVNNTPVVAVFIPMISDLAEESHLSPSKFLIPLSYAAMLGGTLTLIGTSTNIVASDLVATDLVPDHGPIGMFELTPLGVVVLLVGSVYLLTVAPRLLPERVPATLDVTDTYEVSDYLAQVRVRESSALVGQRVEDAFTSMDLDVDVLQLVRDEEVFIAPGSDRDIVAGDVLTVRANLQDVNRFAEAYDLRQLPREEVSGDSLSAPWIRGELLELVIPPESEFVGDTLAELRFRERYGGTVMAIRRGSRVTHERLDAFELSGGDSLLVYATSTAAELLADEDEVLVTRGPADETEKPALSPKTPVAVGILLTVIGLAAFTHFPIVVTALGGVVAMVVTGCLDIDDAYDAVSWNVIFLLAGILPLSAALQASGGADYLADLLVLLAEGADLLLVVGAFYVLTGLLANVITPVASVALLVPVAAQSANELGADPFSFVLAVTFAGSTAFMTPIGYQTNLMVYGPGGYRFTDYLRVGAPLQLLLAVVTTLGIGVLWPPG